MNLISYWNNQSERYDIISEQVMRGTGWEGVKCEWCVRREWFQPPPSIIDQFTPWTKINSFLANLIAIYEAWFSWFSLKGQDWRVQGGFYAFCFVWHYPYYRKCVTILGMVFKILVWVIYIVCIRIRWLISRTTLRQKWWLYLAES